jgi:hypothetical protein
MPDIGGTMILFDGPTLLGPWTAELVQPWANPTDLGDPGAYTGPYFYAIEQGNYLAYQGNSPPSNILGPL